MACEKSSCACAATSIHPEVIALSSMHAYEPATQPPRQSLPPAFLAKHIFLGADISESSSASGNPCHEPSPHAQNFLILFLGAHLPTSWASPATGNQHQPPGLLAQCIISSSIMAFQGQVSKSNCHGIYNIVTS